jgi:hypothetical protein
VKSAMRSLGRLFPVVMAVAVLLQSSSPAWAMFDMGFGYGFGMGGMGPSAVSGYLNDHALVGAARGMQGVPSRTPLAGNPNSFHNRLRDDGFVSHRDVRRRQPPTYRPEPMASLGNGRQVQQSQTPAAASQPDLPLVSFFDSMRRLIWPGESPVNGDLRELRDTSDLASLNVLDETKQSGTASITMVTTARERLLDYGRPALRDIRANATPRIADSFHQFLLSLYESLAQAALPR